MLGTGGFSVSLLALAPQTTVGPCAVLLFVTGVCFTLWTSNANAILQLRRARPPARPRRQPLPLRVRGPRAARRPARRLARRRRRHAARFSVAGAARPRDDAARRHRAPPPPRRRPQPRGHRLGLKLAPTRFREKSSLVVCRDGSTVGSSWCAAASWPAPVQQASSPARSWTARAYHPPPTSMRGSSRSPPSTSTSRRSCSPRTRGRARGDRPPPPRARPRTRRLPAPVGGRARGGGARRRRRVSRYVAGPGRAHGLDDDGARARLCAPAPAARATRS